MNQIYKCKCGAPIAEYTEDGFLIVSQVYNPDEGFILNKFVFNELDGKCLNCNRSFWLHRFYNDQLGDTEPAIYFSED